jgi:hypothetical protein
LVVLRGRGERLGLAASLGATVAPTDSSGAAALVVLRGRGERLGVAASLGATGAATDSSGAAGPPGLGDPWPVV